MQKYLYHQLDVFTDQSLLGNLLAVVHKAGDISEEKMSKFANWTNLSETIFLSNPKHHLAHYRVRIFTPSSELPFAGRTTLGSCYAWLANGGKLGLIQFLLNLKIKYCAVAKHLNYACRGLDMTTSQSPIFLRFTGT